MEKRPARVAAIHDLSGFGRCSISVILPVLSAMGVQVCPVLTAVLSAHTGGLGDVVFRDLTDYIHPTLEHYKKLGIDFEAVYSGFLGSEEQVGSCIAEIEFLAVDDHILQFFLGFPYRHLRIGYFGNIFGDIFQYLFTALREVAKQTVMKVFFPRITDFFTCSAGRQQ